MCPEWRRCGRSVVTCSANHDSAAWSGAGPSPKVTPAPKDVPTCSENAIDPRQVHDIVHHWPRNRHIMPPSGDSSFSLAAISRPNATVERLEYVAGRKNRGKRPRSRTMFDGILHPFCFVVGGTILAKCGAWLLLGGISDWCGHMGSGSSWPGDYTIWFVWFSWRVPFPTWGWWTHSF